MNKLYSATKYSLSIFIFFALSSAPLFSQNAKEYKQSRLILDYNYYGVPFFINIGYMYRKDSSQLFFPLVGVSIESGKYSFNMFANAKMEYRYKRSYFQIGFKQGLIPYIGDSYKHEYLESYGQFILGHFFENVDISYNLDAGNMYILDSNTKNLTAAFQINHSVETSSLLYNDAANTLSIETSASIDTIPNSKQHSYSIIAEIPYTFYHYWGEFAIMPAIRYSQYFENSKKNYAIGDDYLGSMGMKAIAGKMESHNTLYNFISSLHLEYRFYLRFLPDAFRSIYFVGYSNLGYGKEIDQTFSEGRILYAAGGGIGYSLFGIAPMQLTFGIDQSNNIMINFVVSTIRHKKNFQKLKILK